MIVQMRFEDFRETLLTEQNNRYCSPFTTTSSSSTLYPHVVVGCCFADLFNPLQLARYLHVITGESGALLYFPITFKGQTDTVIDNDTTATTHNSKMVSTQIYSKCTDCAKSVADIHNAFVNMIAG
jgi:hypothetical protein